MNIYHLTRADWRTLKNPLHIHDQFMVAATTEIEAVDLIAEKMNVTESHNNTWTDKVAVKLVGTTDLYDQPTELMRSFVG